MPTIGPAEPIRNEHRYRLVCQGLDEAELFALYRAIEEEFHGRQSFRNPFPQAFDAKEIHEIILYIGASTPLAYVGKKAVDILAGLIEGKLREKPQGNERTVTIYGPDGAVVREVITKPQKPPR